MKNLKRRAFLKEAAVVSAGLASAVNATPRPPGVGASRGVEAHGLPERRIGKHVVSRLIIGGNPFSQNAHSEPLVYANELFKHYFTDDKIAETLAIAVKRGINTFLGRIDESVVRFLKHFEKKAGQAMPWIAQTGKKPQSGATREQILDNIRLAADNGAMGIYFHGVSADYLVQQGRLSEIASYLEFIRKRGLVAGVGAHEITTIEACERTAIQPDFYVKSLNRLQFCCPDFDRTKEFMARVKIPWIAIKVLAAGRIQPHEGFAEALKTGADFLCVGMFDFQVERNVKLAGDMFKGNLASPAAAGWPGGRIGHGFAADCDGPARFPSNPVREG